MVITDLGVFTIDKKAGNMTLSELAPGVYVKRIVHVPNAVKHIEQRTVRKREAAPAGTGEEV